MKPKLIFLFVCLGVLVIGCFVFFSIQEPTRIVEYIPAKELKGVLIP